MVDLDSTVGVVKGEHIRLQISCQRQVQGHVENNAWGSGAGECGLFAIIVTVLTRPREVGDFVLVVECLNSVVLVPLVSVA
jgi:hypothetical protein